jgi:hypothetical protein
MGEKLGGWVCGCVGQWVGVWVCGCVGGCVGVWVCGCVGRWVCSYLLVGDTHRSSVLCRLAHRDPRAANGANDARDIGEHADT